MVRKKEKRGVKIKSRGIKSPSAEIRLHADSVLEKR